MNAITRAVRHKTEKLSRFAVEANRQRNSPRKNNTFHVIQPKEIDLDADLPMEYESFSESPRRRKIRLDLPRRNTLLSHNRDTPSNKDVSPINDVSPREAEVNNTVKPSVKINTLADLNNQASPAASPRNPQREDFNMELRTLFDLDSALLPRAKTISMADKNNDYINIVKALKQSTKSGHHRNSSYNGKQFRRQNQVVQQADIIDKRWYSIFSSAELWRIVLITAIAFLTMLLLSIGSIFIVNFYEDKDYFRYGIFTFEGLLLGTCLISLLHSQLSVQSETRKLFNKKSLILLDTLIVIISIGCSILWHYFMCLADSENVYTYILGKIIIITIDLLVFILTIRSKVDQVENTIRKGFSASRQSFFYTDVYKTFQSQIRQAQDALKARHKSPENEIKVDIEATGAKNHKEEDVPIIRPNKDVSLSLSTKEGYASLVIFVLAFCQMLVCLTFVKLLERYDHDDNNSLQFLIVVMYFPVVGTFKQLMKLMNRKYDLQADRLIDLLSILFAAFTYRFFFCFFDSIGKAVAVIAIKIIYRIIVYLFYGLTGQYIWNKVRFWRKSMKLRYEEYKEKKALKLRRHNSYETSRQRMSTVSSLESLPDKSKKRERSHSLNDLPELNYGDVSEAATTTTKSKTSLESIEEHNNLKGSRKLSKNGKKDGVLKYGTTIFDELILESQTHTMSDLQIKKFSLRFMLINIADIAYLFSVIIAIAIFRGAVSDTQSFFTQDLTNKRMLIVIVAGIIELFFDGATWIGILICWKKSKIFSRISISQYTQDFLKANYLLALIINCMLIFSIFLSISNYFGSPKAFPE